MPVTEDSLDATLVVWEDRDALRGPGHLHFWQRGKGEQQASPCLLTSWGL